jgi:hypothetical protein
MSKMTTNVMVAGRSDRFTSLAEFSSPTGRIGGVGDSGWE